MNEDGSFDVEAFRAADLERVDRASTRIKPGAHVPR